MNSDLVEITEKGRLLFHGSCLDVLAICKGFCCRVFKNIQITPDEYKSGLYPVDVMCFLTKKECVQKKDTCRYRYYRLRKGQDGSCIFQDSNNKCSIQDYKPLACADFSCRGGWKLNNAQSASESDSKAPAIKQNKESFIDHLTEEMTFVSHPLIKLHTVFNVKEKEEIIFIKEMVGKCGKFHSRDSFQYPQFDDDLLLRLIHLFDSKDSLQEIRQSFCDQHEVCLTKSEFYELIWLFNKHKIILEAKNFGGMLAGMGRI